MTEYMVFPLRLKTPLRTKIIIGLSRKLAIFFGRRGTAHLAASILQRGLNAARYDIEIKDGHRWHPIAKAEHILRGATVTAQ